MDDTENQTDQENFTEATAPENGDVGASLSAGVLAGIRDLVIRAYPDVVPELIAGNSYDELLNSIEPARRSYAEIAARLKQELSVANPPAGGAVAIRTPIRDLEHMPSEEKLRAGLRERQGGMTRRR